MIGCGTQGELGTEIEVDAHLPLASREWFEAPELRVAHLRAVWVHIDYLGR